MSKKQKQTVAPAPLPTRPSQDITNEFTRLCAELGNELFQFEVKKSQYFVKFQALNAEMLRAIDLETKQAEQLKANLDDKSNQLIDLVAKEATK